MKTGIVVGNGLVGACTALALQRAGLQVVLVDPGDLKAAASYGNAGHLAVEQTDPLASRANVRSLPGRVFSRGGPVAFPLRDVSAWLPFGLKLLSATSRSRFERGQAAMQSLLRRAIPAWQRVAAQAGAAHLIRSDGHWIAWDSPESAARNLSAWQANSQGTARIAAASAADLQVLRGQFNSVPVAAARFTGTGQVTDLNALRRALAAAFVAAGGVVKSGSVRDIGDGVALEGGTRLEADVTVVTAGIGAAPVLKRYWRSIPLIAERGYHIEIPMDASQATPAGLPVVFEDRHIILAPFASSLRLSGFTEFSRAQSPPDARKWERLERQAQALGLPMGAHPQRWMGTRPTLPDYLPAMGQHPRVPSLLYAFGHNHLGVTLAALTGELLCSAVMGQAPEVDLSPFALERFQ